MKVKSVLIVEDENLIQRLCKRLMADLDVDLIFVSTIQEGLDVIENTPLDLLITDLKLPDGSGVDVFLRFKRKYEGKDAIIMTGSLTPEEQLSHAERYGSYKFLRKPFDIEDFRSAVTSAIGWVKPER